MCVTHTRASTTAACVCCHFFFKIYFLFKICVNTHMPATVCIRIYLMNENVMSWED